DIAMANQIAEVRAAAGVDDHRAGDEGDPLPGFPGGAHHLGNPHHPGLDPPLGRDLIGHEREAKAIAGLELGDDLDAVDAADDLVALADLAQLAAHGDVAVDDDR